MCLQKAMKASVHLQRMIRQMVQLMTVLLQLLLTVKQVLDSQGSSKSSRVDPQEHALQQAAAGRSDAKPCHSLQVVWNCRMIRHSSSSSKQLGRPLRCKLQLWLQ